MKLFIPISIIISTLVLLSITNNIVVQATETVLGIHGSGTTNPSKCYWNILDRIESQSRLPLHTTYRAVGSTTGQEEFANDLKQFANIDFASGDIPIVSEDYNKLADAGIGVVHLPILLGAVSVFHSVPDTPDLNLTACLLAKIYTREITKWTDDEIVNRNPNLKVAKENDDITVGVRLKGSSSTESFTKYLHNACPEVFKQSMVGALPDWPQENKRCQGSGGMTECITSKPGTIGYIDSGHGHSAGLEEIDLENLQGTFLNSKVAKERGGIAAARNAFPASTTDDFGDVTLVNAPGANTWPIIQMTYIYVRRDLSYMKDPNEQSLLMAFLRSLIDIKYVGECAEKYGFTIPTPEVQDFALSGIALLEQDLLPNATKWIFENSTMPMIGAGNYVISPKRKSIADVERDALQKSVVALTGELEALQAQLNGEGSTTKSSSSTPTVSAEAEEWLSTNLASRDTQLMAALVLSCISFVFWILYLAYVACRYMGGGGGSSSKGGHSSSNNNTGMVDGNEDVIQA